MPLSGRGGVPMPIFVRRVTRCVREKHRFCQNYCVPFTVEK
jgi:hypothetical protein